MLGRLKQLLLDNLSEFIFSVSSLFRWRPIFGSRQAQSQICPVLFFWILKGFVEERARCKSFHMHVCQLNFFGVLLASLLVWNPNGASPIFIQNLTTPKSSVSLQIVQVAEFIYWVTILEMWIFGAKSLQGQNVRHYLGSLTCPTLWLETSWIFFAHDWVVFEQILHIDAWNLAVFLLFFFKLFKFFKVGCGQKIKLFGNFLRVISVIPHIFNLAQNLVEPFLFILPQGSILLLEFIKLLTQSLYRFSIFLV